MPPTTVLVPNEEGATLLRRHFAHLDNVTVLPLEGAQASTDVAAGADVLIPDFIPSAATFRLASELPRLRLVQLLTSGADAWINRIPANVMLSNARGAHSAATAEWIVAALLSIYRGFTHFEHARQRQEWDHHHVDSLDGKRILGVGAGDLARRLRPQLELFGATLTLVGATARDGVHGRDELLDLIPQSDAVVLMAPLTPHTAGMVDPLFLGAMPDQAVLVNAARGQLVNTAALVAQLYTGRLRAALDVTDPEPLPARHPLWHAPGLLLTPHVGGHVRGNMDRAYAVAAEQIRCYRAGQSPANLVRGDY